MSDYHDRQGGGGGQRNRKRRYRDDEDHYDRRNQRRRHNEAPPPARLRHQLIKIAESPLRRWAEEVQSIAALVSDNYDSDADLGRNFVDLAMQLSIEQPLKTPFVAAVVLVANTREPKVAGDVLARLAKDTEESLDAGDWRKVKLRIKLLACLQSLLEGDGVFGVLEGLFARAADLQTASSEDTIGTEIVKIILLTIPYILASAPGQLSQQKAAELMEKTDIIASEPHALQALVDPFHPENKEKTPGSESLCMLLQKQLQNEAANNWELKCLPRPWQMPLEDIEVQEKLSNPTKHALPAINIPQTPITGPRALFPEMFFSVYANQDAESVPSPANIASSLIRDGLVDTINILDFNRHAVAHCLMNLDCYFAEGTFVKRATAFDDLRNFPSDRSTWKPEDVAVDTVFSQLFQLPNPERKVVYYHSVLTEACKLAPAAIAPSLGRAIRFLYRNSPQMDLDLSYRFLDWFSHHLSNFGFTWKWSEWAEDAELPDLDPKSWFLKGALDKEIRLSFAQRIQKTVPEPYQPLIGPDKELDVPPFKYANPDTPFSAEGQEIASLLRKKAPDEDFQPTISHIQTLASERGLDPLVTSTSVFVTSICFVGSKSLSHVLACIDRTKARLLDIGSQSEAARAQIVASIMEYWSAHPGVALSIVQKLLNYAVLTPFSVVDWALVATSPSNGTQGGESLAKAHVYEIVSSTVTKVTARVRQDFTAADVPSEQREKDAASMRDMFRSMNDALASWAGGNKDEQMEGGDGSSDREAMIRRWGQRWLRVFQRRQALEEAFLLEAEKEGEKMVVEENGAAES